MRAQRLFALLIAAVIAMCCAGATAAPTLYAQNELVVSFNALPAELSAPATAKMRAPRGGKQLNRYAASARPASDDFDTVARKHGLLGYRVLEKRGGKRRAAVPASSVAHLVFSPGADVEQIATELNALPSVDVAEPNFIGSLVADPAEPLSSSQATDYNNIGMLDAWVVQNGASGVRIAVIDSGVEADHPDLAAAIDLDDSYNFADDNTSITDDLDHGTRVAGIVAAPDNGAGVAGVAFGATLLSLDVANSLGNISLVDVLDAINWAIARDADILNFSLRFNGYSENLETACNSAIAAGLILVAAAGNENQGDAPVYPASFDGVMGVGAMQDNYTQRASYSNYNGAQRTLVDLFAPGDTVFTTSVNGTYDGSAGSGTSFAAPMVSGVAALLKAKYPAQSATAITSHLLRTASAAGALFSPADGAGFGKLNAEAALETAMVPQFAYASVRIDDNTGLSGNNNNDGTLDKDEVADVYVTLTNNGADATTISGVLSSSSGFVTVNSSATAWPDMLSGASAEATAAARVTISGAATADDLSFSLALTANGTYNQALPFAIPVEAETVVASGYTVPAATNVTWNANETYVLDGLVNVLGNLTIQPGTTIRAKQPAKIDVLNNGTLSAVGSAVAPISFLPKNVDLTPSLQEGDLRFAVQTYGAAFVRVFGSAATSDGGFVAVGELGGFAPTQFGNGESGTISITPVGPPDGFVARYDSTGKILWVRSISGGGGDTVSCVSITPAGDIFVGGWFARTVVLGAGEPTSTTLTVPGNPASFSKNALIAKYTSSGSLLWAKQAGGDAGYDSTALALAVLNDGGVAVTGQTQQPVAYFNRGEPTEKSFGISGNSEMFVARYAANADCHWAVHAGSNVTFAPSDLREAGRGITVLPDGSIVAVGNINGTATAGHLETPGPNQCGQQSIGPVAASSDAIVARYNLNGTLRWVKHIMNSGTGYPSAAASYLADTVIVAGVDPGGSTTLGSGESTGTNQVGQTVLTSSSTASYLATLNTVDGTLRAVNAFNGTGNVEAAAAWVDPSGNRFIAGRFTGNVTLAGSSRSSNGLHDAFWCKVDGAGSEVAGGAFGNSTPDEILAGCASRHGFYIGGYFGSTSFPNLTFGANEANETTLVAGTNRTGFVAHYAGAQENWKGLKIHSNAGASSLQHCIFERGGVVNEHGSTSISDCAFNRAPGDGLQSTAGSATLQNSTAQHNAGTGLNIGNRAAQNCAGDSNRQNGIVTSSTATDASATGNNGDGVAANGISNSTATLNRGRGLVSSNGITNSLATGNRGNGAAATGGDVTGTVAQNNGGAGISISGGGTADDCRSQLNGTGISTDGSAVTDCIISNNTGVGVAGAGASTVSNSRIHSNGTPLGGALAVTGVGTVQNSAVYNNESGLSGVGTTVQTYVSGNRGTGISGGAISASTIVANAMNGVLNAGSVANSWIVRNGGTGVLGNNSTVVTSSTVTENRGGGVHNLSSANGNNLLANSTFDAKDTQSPFNTKDFTGNYWGTTSTAYMQLNADGNVDAILDGNDAGNGGHDLVYSPFAETELAGAPDTTPPSFVVSTVPNVSNFVEAGQTTVTLSFSEDMNTAVSPAVTAGRIAPFDANIVQPLGGWLDARTWQGVLNVTQDTDEGTNTLRITNATDASGFVIPDDQSHQFVIAEGNRAANNGLVTGTTKHTTKIEIGWTTLDQPAQFIGYHIERSFTEAGEQTRLTSTPIKPAKTRDDPYLDENLTPGTTYYYQIVIVHSNGEEEDWTPITPRDTLPAGDTAVGDWERYF